MISANVDRNQRVPLFGTRLQQIRLLMLCTRYDGITITQVFSSIQLLKITVQQSYGCVCILHLNAVCILH